MYFEPEKKACVQRANNEFLRRMLGGELGTGCALPTGDRQSLPEYPTRPPCDGGTDEHAGCKHGSNHREECPNAPSLAMVYAPKQSWRGVFDPHEALMHGTQFGELVLPFEGYKKTKGGLC